VEQSIPHVFVGCSYYLFFAGVKVRRLNEDGESVPVYPTTISLLAEYDPKVESILLESPNYLFFVFVCSLDI
jgi:hypothetical protein